VVYEIRGREESTRTNTLHNQSMNGAVQHTEVEWHSLKVQGGVIKFGTCRVG
jgi:hypothetical protein